MSLSRAQNSIKNIVAALVNRGTTYMVRFVLRTIFIYTLSSEYLGVSSLFSSILTVLSLADLGFGIAMPYSLYKPLKDNDVPRIQMLMDYYSRIYCYVAISVVVLGMILVPFLGVIIDFSHTTISDIKLIYILYVVQSAVSYLFYYKKTLIIADQKNYIVNKIECYGNVAVCIIESIALIIFKNFIVYLLIGIFGIVFINCLISYKCDKLYPFLKLPVHMKIKGQDRKKNNKNIMALAIYKGAMAIETSISSIIITKIFGLVIVGIWSNYNLIIMSINGILQTIFNSITSSIGNLIVEKNNKNLYIVYRALNLANYWGYGVATICIVMLIQSFIGIIWINKEYMIENDAVLFMALNLFVCGSQNMNGNFRDAYGLFWQGRYRPLLMIISQVTFSYVLAKYFNIAGIYIGIILSRLVTVGIIDPYIVHKFGLHTKLSHYYMDYYTFFALTILNLYFTYYVTNFILVYNIYTWIIKGLATFVLCNAFYFICYFNTKPFKYLYNRLLSV